MKERKQLPLSRREFIQAGAAAAAALPTAALLGARAVRAEEKLVTDMPDQAFMVQALQYLNVSDRPGENCANCQFYTPGEGGTGKCTLIPVGLVSEGGSCASYVTKVE
ncbi:MAG: high-potential iron-sulfur protein [Myxococcales bacterium]|nr:high-potential iron-sulfur protein [Myxococcales bacterium]